MTKKTDKQRIAELEARVKDLEEAVTRISLNNSTRRNQDDGLIGTMLGPLGMFV